MEVGSLGGRMGVGARAGAVRDEDGEVMTGGLEADGLVEGTRTVGKGP